MKQRNGEFQMSRVLGTMVVVALAGAGCSGSKANDVQGAVKAATDETTTTAPEGSVATSPSSKAKSKSTPTTAPKATSNTLAPPPSLPPTDPAKPTLQLTAQLKETCVSPGGSQSITIKAEPDSAVGYDSVYSDGKQGMMPGHYGGNSGTPHVDDQGTWSDTWIVGANAPAGPVQVNVLGAKLDYNAGQTVVYFKVADVTGKCS